MKCYNQVCELLCKAIIAFCSVLAVVMLCCSALQVFSRYFLGNSFTWTEESARYCFIWLDMLGVAALVYKGGHATVDLFSHKLHGNVKKVYQTLIYCAIFYVAVIIARYGLELSKITFKQTSSSLKLPMGVVYGVVPISGILIVFFVVNRIINLWLAQKETGKEET